MNPTHLTSWCILWAAASLALAGCGNNTPAAPKANSGPSTSKSNEIREEVAAKPSSEAAKSEAAKSEATETGESAKQGVTPVAETSSKSDEGDWGTLKGKFVFDGTAPVPAAIVVTRDAQVCGNHGLKQESLLVDQEGGLANVVVWVTTSNVKIHPGYESQKELPVTVGNKNCRFDPHVVTYWTEQPLELRNFDGVGHNFDASALRENLPFNDSVPAFGTLKKTNIKKSERLPSEVRCGSHTWMQGWFVVKEHPYTVVTAPDGTFEIKNVPTGELEFQFWHEKSGYVRNVEVDGKPAEWKRGQVKLTIKPGENDLGVVKVPASLFNK